MTENPQQPPTPPSGPQLPPPPPGPGQPYAAQPYATTAQPMSPSDEKLWATLVHLSPFLGVSFLGPLIVYLVCRDRGPFIRFHAAQALNFQLIVLIGVLVSLPLMIVFVGFLTIAIVAVASFILQIVAAVQANSGQWYRYPLTPDWVK